MDPQWDASGALSIEAPTEEEKELAKALDAYLHEAGQYESSAQAKRRAVVLGQINRMVKEWVKAVLVAKKQPESVAASAGGKIFTYGSYRLGVCTESSDIDTLCVVPREVTFDDFFTTFQAALEARPEVTKIVAVRDANVPILKISFADIEVDLIMASLAMSSIPDSLTLDGDDVLQGLTEAGVRSLNGSRVTDMVLSVIPNRETFRVVLRAIRLWSKRRLLYGFLNGFFNGITLAIMVARMCQFFPFATPAKVLKMFFTLFKEWQWRVNPIRIAPARDSPLNLVQWDPTSYKNSRDVMPVLTPAYPSANSNSNITRSTVEIIKGELERGDAIVAAVFDGSATWDALFDKLNFFKEYSTFFQISAYAGTPEAMGVWHGYVASRILRDFLIRLENDVRITGVRMYTKEFENSMTGEERENCTFFVGLAFADDILKRANRVVDLSTPAASFTDAVHRWPNRSADMVVEVTPCKRSGLPDFVKAMLKAEKKEAKRKLKRLERERERLLEAAAASAPPPSSLDPLAAAAPAQATVTAPAPPPAPQPEPESKSEPEPTPPHTLPAKRDRDADDDGEPGPSRKRTKPLDDA